MKKQIKNIIFSDIFLLINGLIVVPFLSFAFLSLSPESPLYTSISRIAWVHNLWFATFVWAILVMGVIILLTCSLARTGITETRTRSIFLTWQIISTIFTFVGCIMFPAKSGPDNIIFANYIHDYLTAIAWGMYVIGLVVYSIYIRKQNTLLGTIALGLIGYIIVTSIFFLIRVVDPSSYVGASAVSEVYIINILLLYLVVMNVLQNRMHYHTQKENQNLECERSKK